MSAAARSAAPASSIETTCSTVIRPLANVAPSWNTDGTASTWRVSASSLNTAPSIATWVMFGLRTLITLSAWTTSGQFWHDSEKNVSKWCVPGMARIWSASSSLIRGGWPPTWRSARTSEVNSCPSGMPAKRTCTGVPTRSMLNDGARSSLPSRRTVTSSESPAISSSRPISSVDLALSSSVATSSIGWRSEVRCWRSCWLSVESSMGFLRRGVRRAG